MQKWMPAKCNCAVAYTLSVVGGKWKWLILYRLFQNKMLRYGKLKQTIPSITHKMLSQQLKELEAQQLLHREEYQQIPPKVEYSLTEKGASLLPILQMMEAWGSANKPVHPLALSARKVTRDCDLPVVDSDTADNQP